MVLGLFAAVTPSATAGPVDAGWTAAGPGTVQTVSDGSASAAAMTYNGDGLGSASWTFTTTATPTSANGTPIRVPWTWQGLHAWFQVTAQMDAVVIRNGVQISSTNLVDEGPEICCTEPSNGFLYGGIHEFNVQPGDVYGFRLSGSNSDYNNFLRGTFTLSTKPYIDATIGTDNRQWIGATEISTATLPATTAGYLEEPGEARWYKFRVVPGQQATVSLTNPADYDLALYGDIGNAYDQLASGADLTQLAAASAAGTPGSETQTPVYDPAVTTIPTTATKPPVTTQFAPRCVHGRDARPAHRTRGRMHFHARPRRAQLLDRRRLRATRCDADGADHRPEGDHVVDAGQVPDRRRGRIDEAVDQDGAADRQCGQHPDDRP